MTIKSLFLALLIAALGGSLCAQTPNGAYSSPAIGSGSSSSGAAGIPTVTNGLTADCSFTEGTGTATNCGSAGSISFPAYPNAPVWTNNPTAAGTVQAIDSFTNAALGTAGNWTTVVGTVATSAGSATASVVDGTSLAVATYTGIPASQNQFAQVAFGSAPASGGSNGVTLRASTSTKTFYSCANTDTTLLIGRDLAGTFTTLNSVGRAGASGDIINFSVVENPNLTSATLTCKATTSGGVTVTLTTTDASIWAGQTGLIFGLTNPSSPSARNFQSGTFNTGTPNGGLVFGGGQFLSLPASLNSSLTIEAYGCYQHTSNTNAINALVIGNGNGAASNANGLILSGAATTGNPIATTLGRVQAVGGSAVTTAAYSLLNGCGSAAMTLGTSIPTSLDHLYLNGQEVNPYVQTQQGASAGLQTVGNYQIGGAASGSGFATATLLTGTIYRIRTFSRVLTPSEIAQDAAAFNEAMSGRGILTASFDNGVFDSWVATGDSLTSGFGLASASTQAWTQNVFGVTPANGGTYVNSGHPWNQGVTAAQMCGFNANQPDYVMDPLYTPQGTRNVVTLWAGTNDDFFNGSTFSATAVACMANYARARRAVGWKVIVIGMISRGTAGSCTFDVNKDAFNPLVRQYWANFADEFVDAASDPVFADGGCTGTSFQADNIHMSAHGSINHLAPMFDHAVNALFGNRDFSTANTYAATATAATATTAGSESGNTVTITMAATQPWAAGQCVVVAGVTPAGYNSAANSCFLVLTASSTQITYFNPTSGLGVITVQGTVQGPQELDQDVYAILGGAAAAPAHILESCQGRTGHTIYRQVTNTNAAPWVLTPQYSGETINGAATMNAPVATATNHPIVSLKAVLTSNTAGGCTWQASLQ